MASLSERRAACDPSTGSGAVTLGDKTLAERDPKWPRPERRRRSPAGFVSWPLLRALRESLALADYSIGGPLMSLAWPAVTASLAPRCRGRYMS